MGSPASLLSFAAATVLIQRIAAAEPISLTIGGGIGSVSGVWGTSNRGVVDFESQSTHGLELTFGYRWKALTFGGHLGTPGVLNAVTYEEANAFGFNDTFTFLPVDLGLTVQYEHGRFWLSPWVGRTFIRYRQVDTSYRRGVGGVISRSTTNTLLWFDDGTSAGVMAGADFAVIGDGCNRFSLFASARTGIFEDPSRAPGSFASDAPIYTAFFVGVAYRYVGR